MCCSVLQCVAAHHLHVEAVEANQEYFMELMVLQCVAVCYRVVQCVAVRCKVLQCVAVYILRVEAVEAN